MLSMAREGEDGYLSIIEGGEEIDEEMTRRANEIAERNN
jgi:hypothetical protein